MQPTSLPSSRTEVPAPGLQRALAELPFRIIGESPRFLHALESLRRIAFNDAPLLVEGEFSICWKTKR